MSKIIQLITQQKILTCIEEAKVNLADVTRLSETCNNNFSVVFGVQKSKKVKYNLRNIRKFLKRILTKNFVGNLNKHSKGHRRISKYDKNNATINFA